MEKDLAEDLLALNVKVNTLKILLQKHSIIPRDEYLEVAMMLVSVAQKEVPGLDWGRILQKIEGDP